MKRLQSVLVIRLSSLGDVLFALPAVQALLASGLAERVSWLVEDRAAPLLSQLEGLHELVVFPRSRPSRWPAHAAALRSRHDDAVIDLQGNLKSRAQMLFLRSARKIGFDGTVARERAERALTEPVSPPPGTRHRVALNMTLMARLGVDAGPDPPRPAFPLARDAQDRAAALLATVPGGGPVVVLHAGTSPFGELKRWSPDRFGQLGDHLVREHGARVLLTGSPSEQPLVSAVARSMRQPGHIVPSASLQDLAALLARADVVVAADSLPLHLANALGTAVVGLYGPKDPAVTGPFWDRAEVVRAGVACSPCTLRRCGDRICMDRLDVVPVAEAVERLLSP